MSVLIELKHFGQREKTFGAFKGTNTSLPGNPQYFTWTCCRYIGQVDLFEGSRGHIYGYAVYRALRFIFILHVVNVK